MWMIYLAVASDLFGDGLLIGSGTAVTASLGLALAVGQVFADVPEGAASAETFRANDVPRRRRLVLSASFVLPVTVVAAASYLTLRNQSEAAQLAALVATAGLFSVAVFEDMITEAHDAAEDTRTSTAALLVGFAVFHTRLRRVDVNKRLSMPRRTSSSRERDTGSPPQCTSPVLRLPPG